MRKAITFEQWLDIVSRGKRKQLPSGTEKFLCQCRRGHIFDFRNRKRFDDSHHAPCDGVCPYCESPMYTISKHYGITTVW